ncbi:alpha/beta fold hydrolase [Ideonella sp. BN130291]|uniref:alpha/beta fold hydrolase n=1 Tax=Ideonella sp. BN130291 TaxID=3112940 RepID=UPI002E257812|nr:alpha/beta fold hydrolase [Ideonella sp. BN130291]
MHAAEITTFDLPLPNGITLSCRSSGPPGAPRIVFLHGFPEAAFVWDEVMAALGGRFHCIAPNLRGYERSSAPTDVAAYKPKLLMGDIAALIEATGGPVDLLVAHDWGGALAWNLAAQRPELLKRLLAINTPHPATFLRDLQHDPAQQAASAYMSFLCRPDAEVLLAENDYARLWPFFGQAAWLTDEVKAQYRAVWSRGLTGPLNYYRASPLKPPTGPDDEVMKITLPPHFTTVNLPTRVLWGEADHALLPGLLNGLEAYLPQGEVVRVPGASHWIVHEQPQRVVQQIEQMLGR